MLHGESSVLSKCACFRKLSLTFLLSSEMSCCALLLTQSWAFVLACVYALCFTILYNVHLWFACDTLVLKMLRHVIFELRVAVTQMPTLFSVLYEYSKPIDRSEKYMGKSLLKCSPPFSAK